MRRGRKRKKEREGVVDGSMGEGMNEGWGLIWEKVI